MIIIVSSVGDFWVKEDVAKSVAQAMNDEVKHITLNGNIIATNSIRGLLQQDEYKKMARIQNRKWQCQYGNVHNPDETCRCKLELTAQNKNLLGVHKNTDLDNLKAEATREWISVNKGNWELIKNSEERRKFVEKYIKKHKNNEKS